MAAHTLLLLIALFFVPIVPAHMILASPIPFGNPTTSPLNSDGSNYPCQIVGTPATFYNESSSTSSNNTMAIGATQTLSFYGSAIHAGGSCQLALTKDMQPSASTSWQVILSIEGGCPTTDDTGPSTYDYTIPSSISPGKYVFAWSWISKLSGAPEYYMNCAPVTITGGSAKRDATLKTHGDNSTSPSSSVLPNLFVANLASINSCKTTTSTDPVYPDPGPNVLKPSKMTTNFQPPTGTDCFPLGATNSSSSSIADSGSASVSVSSAALSSASSALTLAVSLPGTTFLTLTKSAAYSLSTTLPTHGTAVTGSGGIPGTASRDNSLHATKATISTTVTSATPLSPTLLSSASPHAAASAGSTASTGSDSGLTGACTSEGTFNCVGGTKFQQCASGVWTVLQAMPAGTTCQKGQSTTLWNRRDPGLSLSPSRLRYARRA
ncbi:hypothetical protein SEPCBS57363_002220 [Sporothrix epigloea]|uniref:Lytic polysaccharide monooxygenase n=1 Tax=Sporothrix epigloea TaxID=1892477 RepID=A0ABP0DGC7_9PEZI